jgi:phosphoglycolate phosphatase-like HAD superfamily hydrolase
LTLRELYRREVTLEEVRHMIGDGTRALVERAFAATGQSASWNQRSSVFWKHTKPRPQS